MKGFLVFLGLVAAITATKVTYDNYKVYNLLPDNEDQVKYLKDLQEAGGYDFWSETLAIGYEVRVMVSPALDEDFVKRSEDIGLKPIVTIPNVQTLIDAQLIPAKAVEKNVAGRMTWSEYHTLDQIHAWLDELETLYPNIVTVQNIGTSNEGRLIKGVKIDFRPNSRGLNPLIGIVEGGIHAREWISPACVTGLINEFLTSTNSDVRFLAETFVWYLFPVVNPDGYVYTFTDNRMWRKNRNTQYTTTCAAGNDLSNGIDLNRNFNFVWMSTGASLNPCAETFAGPEAFSEPESRAIANFLTNVKQTGEVIYYFAIHSYSQMILVPYSHVSGNDKLTVSNYGDLYEIAVRGAEKLTEVHGIPYTVGVSDEILYAVSGSSMDWVKGIGEIPITYLFELRDLGEYGFLLPTDQIIPNNEEILACLLEMDRVTRQLGYYQVEESSSGSATILSSVTLILAAAAALLYAN